MDNRTDELERKRAIERGHVRLVIFILLIIIGIGAFFYMRRPHHASTHPQPLAMKKDSSLSYKINKLSNKQIAGMLIYYAHLKYKSNDSWGDIYQEATEGGLKINRYRKYRFENYTVESTDKNYLYVIDDRVVYTISNTKDKSKAKIVFGDSQQELGEANLTTIYTTVMREPNSKKILSEIDHNITLDSDISEQQSSSKSASASSIRSSNDNIKKDKKSPDKDSAKSVATVPAAIQGTWYAPDGSTVTFGPDSFNGQKISNDNDAPYYGDVHGNSINLQTPQEHQALVNGEGNPQPRAYSAATLDGDPVLTFGTPGPRQIYFKDKATAQKYAGKDIRDIVDDLN